MTKVKTFDLETVLEIELSKGIPVLDHGFVRLIGFMQPIGGAAKLSDGDLHIVRNARVSYNADWRTGKEAGKDAKIINFLVKHKHTSPLESLVFSFEVKCPLFVVRQWQRHRAASYNELSARYTEMEDCFYVPDPITVGTQSKQNKQVRDVDGKLTQKRRLVVFIISKVSRVQYWIYKGLLKLGVPRELSRIILPLNMYTRFFVTVSLHNLMHFIGLRLANDAQYEIRVYAEALLKIIKIIAPISVSAFEKHTLTIN